MVDTLKRIQLMLDEQTATILRLTALEPFTASQLRDELRIPHSVCYRKIKQLKEAELLDECKPQDPWRDRTQAKSYISNIDKAFVTLERGEMMIVLKLKNSKHAEVFRLLSPLQDSSQKSE